jgi:hypothetical protein
LVELKILYSFQLWDLPEVVEVKLLNDYKGISI